MDVVSDALQAPFTWNKPEDLQHRKPCPLIPALMQQFPRSVVSDDENVDDDDVDF